MNIPFRFLLQTVSVFMLLAASVGFPVQAEAAPTTAKGFAEIHGQQLEEKLTLWLWKHREVILRSCLSDVQGCGQSDELRPRLEKLQAEVLPSAAVPQFVRETERPELFRTSNHELHRVAVTGSSPGAPIIFNRDRLGGLGLRELSSLLFHEFTHQLGVKDESDRLPDRIGARLAAHVMAQALIHSADEFDAPNIQVVQFQTALKDKYLPTDLNPPPANFALFSDGVSVIDFDLSAFIAAPACTQAGQVLYAQKSYQGRWARGQDESGRPTLRFVALLKNLCGKPFALTGTLDIADRVFAVQIPLVAGTRADISNAQAFLKEPTADDFFDLMRTLKLISVQLSSLSPKPGERLELQAVVKPLAALNTIKNCEVGFYGAHWPRQNPQVPTLETYETCRAEKGLDGLMRVNATMRVPTGLLSGTYRPYVIKLETDGDPALFLFSPNQAEGSFQIENPAAVKPSVAAVTFPGLTPLRSLQGRPMIDSAVFRRDQEFQVVVEVRSKSAPVKDALSLGLLVAMDSGVSVARFSAETSDLGFIVKGREIVPANGGYRIVYRFQVPRQYQQLQVIGVGINRVLLKDADSNWFETTFDQFSHLLFWDEAARMNP